ncbi:MAG: hypothetical protein Q8L14_30685 [Myxococcales bacterium]|nr:hypothetical protein [Myxococcales bacterium]
MAGTRAVVRKCPYCGLNEAEELDHFLEKALLPELALFARNLVPSCHRCNVVRGRTFDRNGRRILQFYDDRIETRGALLVATEHFKSKDTPVLEFKTKNAMTSIGQVFCRHFAALRLESRFRKQASADLATLRGQLGASSETIVKKVLRNDLKATNRREGANSCRSAMLRAILGSPKLLKWVRNVKS